MDYSPDVITYDEKIIYKLRTLYSKYGYEPFKMSRFEEYELYAANKAFLPAGDIITFTGAGGKLMALRPDVTLSIVKGIKHSTQPKKLYYNENVYRTINGELKEQTQVGLECICNANIDRTAEVLMLAKLSLDVLGKSTNLDISHMGFLDSFLNSEQMTAKQKTAITHCISEKNISGVKQICQVNKFSAGFYEKVSSLISLFGKYADVKDKLISISVNNETAAALSQLEQLDIVLNKLGVSDNINIDFSVINDITYYNGIVFQGYIDGVPEKVISGGSYDELVRNFGVNTAAIGFAVYPDLVASLNGSDDTNGKSNKDNLLSIALPKGRLGDKAYELFESAGYKCSAMNDNNRKLVFECKEHGIRYFWVKPSDVSTYVERGVADIGIAGRDSLLESRCDVYDLLDLGIGRCRMCIAARKGREFDCHESILRVATKFPNITREYYAGLGSDIDIIKLHGSIELAPLIGLSDVIVDLVETGTTLADNGMEPIDTIEEISARFICNKASYKFNREKIEVICSNIAEILQKRTET